MVPGIMFHQTHVLIGELSKITQSTLTKDFNFVVYECILIHIPDTIEGIVYSAKTLHLFFHNSTSNFLSVPPSTKENLLLFMVHFKESLMIDVITWSWS